MMQAMKYMLNEWLIYSFGRITKLTLLSSTAIGKIKISFKGHKTRQEVHK